MKCEAKTAAHGWQFCTSVLVPYAVFYFSFSLSRDIYTFPKSFRWKFTQNISSRDRNESKNVECIWIKSNWVTGYIFSRKLNYQSFEKHDKTTSKNYFRKLLNARPIFTVSLSSLHDLARFLGPTEIMNLIKYSIT